MSEDSANCLVCGERHGDASDPAAGCPTMRSVQATDAHPTQVPPEVYTGYLNARDAMRENSPRAAVKGLRKVLSAIAEANGAQPSDGFANKMEKLCDKGIIGARIRDALLKQALSDSVEERQAWALMSIAEHAFYRVYMSKSTRA